MDIPFNQRGYALENLAAPRDGEAKVRDYKGCLQYSLLASTVPKDFVSTSKKLKTFYFSSKMSPERLKRKCTLRNS